MDRGRARAFTWLLALTYVCLVLNHLWNETIGDVPLAMATGQPVDISPIIRATFWERVLYRDGDESFPSDSCEETGRFVGIAPHVGHVMTYLILTDDTQKVVPRLRVQPFREKDPNRRVEPLGGEIRPVINTFPKSPPDKFSMDTNRPTLHILIRQLLSQARVHNPLSSRHFLLTI